MQEINQLNKQIEEFITRYYQNELLKGGLIFTAMSLTAFLSIVLLEYFGRFNGTVRTILFFGFCSGFIFLIYKYLLFPFVSVTRIGKRMDYGFAAKMIGKAIPEVNDRLLNTLQLSSDGEKQSDLLIATLKERSAKLSAFSFKSVIDFKINSKYLKYVIVPLAVFVLLMVFNNSVLLQPASRIVQYEREFIPPAPYSFDIKYPGSFFSGEDIDIQVQLSGKEIPGEMFLKIDGKSYRMRNHEDGGFFYKISGIRSDLSIQATDGKYSSDVYDIEMLSKPVLNGFELMLDYPSYTGKQDESLSNIGDAEVPYGSKLTWKLNGRDANGAFLVLQDSSLEMSKSDEDQFEARWMVKSQFNYQFALENQNLSDTTDVEYRITVIEDKYPVINVDQFVDSLSMSKVFMRGLIKDDYGFTSLKFVVKKGKEKETFPVEFDGSVISQEFYFQFDFNEKYKDVEKLEYYFIVGDNDGINGTKYSKSSKYVYRTLSLKEKYEKSDDLNNSLKSKMSEQLKRSEQLQKKFDKFERQLQEKKRLDWNDKNELKSLIQEKKDLINEIEKSKKELDKISEFSEKQLELDSEILEKQKQLEELYDKLIDDETKKMLEELEKMMDELSKDQLKDQLDKMNLDNEELKQELDRNIELFKELEFEKNFEQMMDRLDQLKEAQDKLSEEKNNPEELKKKQDSLNKEFKEFDKKLEELKKENEELEDPNDLDFEKELREEIKKSMEESSDQLGGKKRKKASKSQKNSSSKMEQMKQKMEGAMSSSEMEQRGEDLQVLRQIMENLLEVSFNQEVLMKDLKTMSRDNPAVVNINKQQNKLKDDFKIINDSLIELSKRVLQISPEINKELRDIKFNMKRTLSNLAERRVAQGLTHQQFIMTASNNLALLLDEIMRQMQQQMSQNKSGKGSCNKPGQSGKPKSGKMKSIREQLKKQMEQMKKQMSKNGNKPKGKGGMKLGSQGSKQLARMAAQQAAMRDQLRKMADKLGKEGKGKAKSDLNKIADMLDKNQEDIINKRITQETLRRQKDIEVKLLESEKALREEGEDNKRESKENRNEYNLNDKILEDYFKKKQSEIELIRKVPLELTPYFKKKNSEYYNKTLSE